jgi:carboxymethylenebutenolidase
MIRWKWLLATACCALSPWLWAQPVKEVALQDSKGQSVRAWVAGPEQATAGILLVHDYFGFTPFYAQAAERLGRAGYRVVAIDLYQGQQATDGALAARLMTRVQQQDRAITDRTLMAGLRELQRPGRKLGSLGFSAGGIDALNASLLPEAGVSATGIVYGFGFGQWPAQRIQNFAGPVLTVTGALDEGSLQASVDLMQRRAALGQPLELHVMPQVGHAYAQPLFEGGKGYSESATALTWKAIDGFFARHLLSRQP